MVDLLGQVGQRLSDRCNANLMNHLLIDNNYVSVRWNMLPDSLLKGKGSLLIISGLSRITWNDNKSYLASRSKRLLIVRPPIKRAPIGIIVVIRVNCINISTTCLKLAKYRENISTCDIVNDKSDEDHDSCEAHYHIKYVCLAKVEMQLEYIYYSHQFMTLMN